MQNCILVDAIRGILASNIGFFVQADLPLKPRSRISLLTVRNCIRHVNEIMGKIEKESEESTL